MAGIAAKLGSRRQAILLGALAVVLLLAVVLWRPGGDAPASKVAAPGPPARAASAARAGGDAAGDEGTPAFRSRKAAVKEVNPDDVPPLRVSDFAPPSGPGADGGRDLFELRDPTKPPPPTATPPPPAPGDVRFVGPMPLPPPTPTPKPPDVSFKFIGTFGPKEHPIAVVQQGDQVVNVRSGDTLFGKFILKKVGYESIDVGFVGFPESETRRLGITP